MRALIYMRDIWNLDPLAHYRNSYGHFSYYHAPELGRVYLKPRINLRDTPVKVDEELAENAAVSSENVVLLTEN
jgi:hypothetical protein